MHFLLGIFHVLVSGFAVLVAEGRWRLIPAFSLFLLLSGLLVLVKAISPIAPFVYSLF
jgi:hypothetical protein